MKYSYQAEKFASARRALMLPHPKGEARSIANAFHECRLGLMEVNIEAIDDDNARAWLERLSELMDSQGLVDPNKKGLDQIKAESLTEDMKLELSRVINELASWFRYVDED